MIKYDKVTIPTFKVVLVNVGDNTYVYFTIRSYRNSEGKPTSQRRIIGKAVDDNTMMIPNSNYFELFNKPLPEGSIEIGDVIRIGNYIVYDKIVTDLKIKEILESAFPTLSNDILSIALYRMVNNK